MSKDTLESLEKILNELTPENIDKLSLEEIVDLRKKINPYGRTIEGAGKFLTFSFINLREKYMEKLLMTSMIGFLNKMCDEWHVPDGIPVIPVYDYVQDPGKLEEFHKDWKIYPKIQESIDENRRWMQKRVVVKQFLEEMFQFNPDYHVRSAYRACPKDLDREIVTTPAAMLAREHLEKKDPAFREQMLEFDRVQALRGMKEDKDEKLDSEIDKLVSRQLVLPSQHYYTMDFSTWTPEDKNTLRRVCEMIPADDTYVRFRRYYVDNYDKLRHAVLHLYCDKPDFDIAINPYQWHEDRESATDFQKKHANEVTADIYIAQSGAWNLLAPFEKITKTAKFFNEKTVVLEEIAKQWEMDASVIKDMLNKRIVTKKKQNIKEEGPDAELFTKWKEENTVLKDMGAVNPEDDCPDNAVQVDIWKISQGGLKLEKDKIFIEAEAPTMPPM